MKPSLCVAFKEVLFSDYLECLLGMLFFLCYMYLKLNDNVCPVFFFFFFFTINATEDTSINSHHLDKKN